MWNRNILDIFEEFVSTKRSIDLEASDEGGSEMRHGFAAGYANLPKEYKSVEDDNDPPGRNNRNKALKVIYNRDKDKPDFKTNWKKFLLSKAQCDCQGTSKPKYAW